LGEKDFPAMPKYYLNVQGGGQTAKDDMGVDVESLAAARDAALALLKNARQASAASQYPITAVVITDEAYRELMTVDLQAAESAR
jgi:hypothetical protein